MFDMSWGEVMIIGGVALIVIGPKDLPKALRTVGQMTAKVRRLASDFQGQFSEAMREAELDEVRREVDGINRQVSTATSAAFNPIQSIRDELKTAVDGKTSVYQADPAAAGARLPAAPVEEAGPGPHLEGCPTSRCRRPIRWCPSRPTSPARGWSPARLRFLQPPMRRNPSRSRVPRREDRH
jgi:sec-independent protein translocase protein TatB